MNENEVSVYAPVYLRLIDDWKPKYGVELTTIKLSSFMLGMEIALKHPEYAQAVVKENPEDMTLLGEALVEFMVRDFPVQAH